MEIFEELGGCLTIIVIGAVIVLVLFCVAAVLFGAVLTD